MVTVDHYLVYDCIRKVPKDSGEEKKLENYAKYFHSIWPQKAMLEVCNKRNV